MSVYLLALVVLPCNDTCGDQEHVTPLTISQAQDHHDAEKDVCSPLCACSCCSSQVIIPSSLVLITPTLPLKRDFSEYTVIHDMGPQYSIWQPPRLG